MMRWPPLAGLVLAFLATTLCLLSLGHTSPRGDAGPQGEAPTELTKYFTPEDVARGQAYMYGRYWLFVAGTLVRLAILGLLITSPASAALRNFAVRLSPTRQALAVAIFIAFLVLLF